MFLKTMAASEYSMLDAEADGLDAIAATATVRTPNVLARGATDADAWLALEWLDMRPLRAATELELGRQLAAMHRHTAERFGWDRDNSIGRTPQPNPWTDDWLTFFAESRLRHQLDLALERGFQGALQDQGRELCLKLDRLFGDYVPVPSLLHGDLWGGNAAAVDGQPVIYDPAVYFGDRESDIAMTRLFGGYGRAFYAAYNDEWHLDAGYTRREPLYQLYHVLNHLNLFGGGYRNRAESLIRDLVAH